MPKGRTKMNGVGPPSFHVRDVAPTGCWGERTCWDLKDVLPTEWSEKKPWWRLRSDSDVLIDRLIKQICCCIRFWHFCAFKGRPDLQRLVGDPKVKFGLCQIVRIWS
ncbi:hypothetical protein NPIL_630701 [Nephila pilipes]|uniref:Uncharacterized protein n=1 Tax=Nephila pilipes TaxID=299642 RepID=A0A8X6TMN7_NEPPI|nr:hypothetical protein NPIL_630701 [Nephila pilipes]